MARSLSVFAGEPVTKALAEAVVSDADREVRREAARSLGKRTDRAATPELVRAVQADGALEVRQAAAVALGLLGGDLARDALAYYATNAENDALRRSAKDALEAMKPDPPPKPKTN
jgi:HEAT repeat protein